MNRLFLTAIAGFLVSQTAWAQAPNSTLSATRLLKDLAFPTQVSSLGALTPVEMAIFKPEGDGPFPGLVLGHQCGGLRDRNWSNESMLGWARKAVAQGYAVLLLDNLAQRNLGSLCLNDQGLNTARAVRDAFQALEHFKTFPFVDKSRIGYAGFSWGAMNGLLISSPLWVQRLSPGGRFNAVVSVYPLCARATPQVGPPYDRVRADIDRPMLVLMGELDNETPPDECVPPLKTAKDAGAPVEWHVYPATTHCWDCKNLNGFSKTDFRGAQVTYRYSEEATRDTERRIFEFFARTMPKS